VATHDPGSFERLPDADLVLDRTYQGGSAGNAGDDPLARLLPIGNQGGFRYKGSPAADSVRVAVLYTSGEEPDWPDFLDVHTGTFTYYGDNRNAGREIHDTQRQGNRLLRGVFEWSRGGPQDRAKVPPFLLFDKPGRGRDARFRGLLCPGSERLGAEEELVAVWRATAGVRFQNYRATFTVLDVPTVKRAWLDEIIAGNPLGTQCPDPWRTWVQNRTYTPLLAPPTVIIRTRAQQLPTGGDAGLLQQVYQHFQEEPVAFERFAADLWRASQPNVDKIDVTRPWRDGGRDAVGEYLLGPRADPVAVEFALEAKCYGLANSVGVREVSRLVSRLRHRQFGVLVTTSYVHDQAYREIREDGHPVVIIAGRDLVDLLKGRGFDTAAKLTAHLRSSYPMASA
jgi:hypothetical protein